MQVYYRGRREGRKDSTKGKGKRKDSRRGKGRDARTELEEREDGQSHRKGRGKQGNN